MNKKKNKEKVIQQPILSISHLKVFYGAIQALRGVTIEIKEGEIVCLIGANGAGKSTLLMSIFGDPRAASGKILFKGENITTTASHKIIHKGISIAPEGRRIFSKMSVSDNLLIAVSPKREKHIQQDFEKIFHLFPILKNRRNQTAGTLSGGEQQMLSIGRALMSEPELLLLDEPSLGLAPKLVQKIFETLANIAKEGTTIFLVEQNAYHALKLANRGYVMVNGEIKLGGSSKKLLNNPEMKKAYLGG